MDSQKKYRVATLIGGGIFILGLLLCCARAVDITSNKIVSAKVISLEEFSGQCRRVSGKQESCLKARVVVEFPINREGKLHTGTVEVERLVAAIVPGSELKVMFKARKPETVKIADISSGWLGPIGVFMIGALILFVSGFSRRA
jgi:hypothetical protein